MKYRYAYCGVGLMWMASTATAVDLDISGFGSFIGGYNDKAAGYLNYDTDDLDFQPDSLAGIQVSGRINDKASATVQIIATALDHWKTTADWAYVTYQPRSDFSWKMGRIRMPGFLFSENVTVGYTYPWITPPFNVYSIPFTAVDGVDLSYSLTVNDVDLEFQAYSGGSQFEPEAGVLEGVKGETRNQFGFVMQASWLDWVGRLAVHQTQLSFDFSNSPSGAVLDAIETSLRNEGFDDVADNLVIQDDRADFFNAALQYDNGTILGIIEGTYYTLNDEAPLGDNHNVYVTAGLRDNDLLYHLTYAQSDTELPDIAGDLPVSSPNYALLTIVETALLAQDESWILGVRWDFAERMAFKAEVVYLPEFQPRVGDITDEFSLNILRMGVQTIF